MRKAIREVLETALLALLIFTGLQASVQNFRVEGSSMRPTLQEGQYLLVNKLVYYHLDKGRLARYMPFVDGTQDEAVYLFRPPHRGEVIVFRFPEDQSRDFVKRVVGIPGDVVEIRDGQAYVNDEAVIEPYAMKSPRVNMAKRVIGPDEYFVLGDNRLYSNDSRFWGPVPLENIVGRVWITFWPVSEMNVF